jgi:hypothetical protein
MKHDLLSARNLFRRQNIAQPSTCTGAQPCSEVVVMMMMMMMMTLVVLLLLMTGIKSPYRQTGVAHARTLPCAPMASRVLFLYTPSYPRSVSTGSRCCTPQPTIRTPECQRIGKWLLRRYRPLTYRSLPYPPSVSTGNTPLSRPFVWICHTKSFRKHCMHHQVIPILHLVVVVGLHLLQEEDVVPV